MSSSVSTGTRLGRYEIRSKIGEGGMGEVYLARDTKLNRDVAIKVLPTAFSENSERLRRFEQEAQAASALNHPNILIVYDVGTHDGAPYVVSELLEGETLRQRLGGSAPGQRRAIDYALHIAYGLAAAHEKGIVHRDLKPDNIFITKDGRVKILDFGVAKLTQPEGVQSQTGIPTRRVNTDPGVVIGTVGYMSPEQVRGKNVDHRSDIFSFGAILYEMLSGRRAFHGESAADTMSAILKEDPPDLSDTNQSISPALARLVNRCLEKNPEARFHSASDLAFALEAISASSGASTQTITSLTGLSPRERIRKYSPWIVAALFALAFLVALPFVLLYFRRPATPAPAAVRFLIAPPEKADYFGAPVISPDGRLMVFGVRDTSGKESLWIRSLDSLEAHPLAGTELVASGGPPFWSTDSRSIGFFSAGKLKRIDVSGGPVQTLCEATFAGGTWNRDGVIVMRSTGGSLARIPSTGGTPTPLTTLDKSRNEAFHAYPYFLPDGRHFLYLARSSQNEKSAIFVGSLDSKETKFVLNADSSMAYAPPGYLIFARQQTLMAQGFNVDKLQLTGEAVPVAERVGRNLATALALFSVSETGVLVYRSLATEQSQLAWFDRAGRQLGTVGEAAAYAAIRLSPDEKHVALQRVDNEKGYYDIWSIEVARGTQSRLTFNPANDVYPIWSPDGSRVVFASNRDGTVNLYQKLSNGAGNDELLFKSDDAKLSNDWSPDGRYILYQDQSPKGFDLWVLPLFEERKPVIFLQTDSEEMYGRSHPMDDGSHMSQTSRGNGRSMCVASRLRAASGRFQMAAERSLVGGAMAGSFSTCPRTRN